ncbi:unnamed protein product [Leptosia nina]|uniref:Uncharacterized protein n=1 Tax=Leptosia nina TaxID=320188 RepID=A0AAV1K705_9NEOP
MATPAARAYESKTARAFDVIMRGRKNNIMQQITRSYGARAAVASSATEHEETRTIAIATELPRKSL